MGVNSLNGSNGFQDPTGFGLTDPAKTQGYEKTTDAGKRPGRVSSGLAKIMLPAGMIDIGQIGAALQPPNYGTPVATTSAQVPQNSTTGAAGNAGGTTITSGGKEKKDLTEKDLKKFSEADPEKAYDMAVKNGWLELAGEIRKKMDAKKADEDAPTARQTPMVIATDPAPSPKS